MAPDTPSSTTPSKGKDKAPKRGRPKKETRAGRRLKRELANKAAIVTVLGFARDITVEIINAARTSPFLAYVVGLATVEILTKVGVVGQFTHKIIVAILGIAIVGGTLQDLTAIANAISGVASVDHLATLGSDVKVDATANTESPAVTAATVGAALSKIAPELAVLE